MTGAQLTVIFDGQCGMCTRTITMLARFDRQDRLRLVPCQSIGTTPWNGVTRDQCEQQVWAIRDSEPPMGAGMAAAAIAGALTGWRWPERLVRIAPVRRVVDAAYFLIARNRRRFPGMTPWCESHPEDCRRTADVSHQKKEVA